MLVHLDSHRILQEHYIYFKVEFPPALCRKITLDSLPKGWNNAVALPETKLHGDDWAVCASSAVLDVPSAISSEESNFLLNPKHSDFGKIKIHPFQRFQFDPRLVKKG
jgi:RES domain-containing protein